MTGAMAGSTAIHHNQRADRLKVITLTINNKCNLSCPHCYLQYDGPELMVAPTLIDAVIESSAQHIAIVGKEPLVDSRSAELTAQLIERASARGKSVSLVTNGLGLNHLSPTSAAALAWIDVSLDGGPDTYARYRRASLTRVLRNVNACLGSGARSVNALHTLSSENISQVDDMMSVSALAEWNTIIFSPYVEVRNHGRNATSPVPLSDILRALGQSKAFCRNKKAILLLGKDSYLEQGLDDLHVARLAEIHGLSGKVIQIAHDPLRLGYIRLTYDGYVMTPYESLHPADYRGFATPLSNYASMEVAYDSLTAA